MPVCLVASPPVSFSHHPGGQPPNLEPFAPGFQEAPPASSAHPAPGKANFSAANWGEGGLPTVLFFFSPMFMPPHEEKNTTIPLSRAQSL